MNDIVPFAYSDLSVDVAQTVRDASQRIKVRMSRTVQDIIEIGRDLIEVKRTIGHGNFLPWIETEFGMNVRTAQRFMDSAENIGSKYDSVSLLPPTILYALAAPSTPDEVREQVVERVSKGEAVTVADIRDLKKTFEAKLAEKDDKLRKIKSQKEAADAHNNRLIDDIRNKSSEVVQVSDEVQNLKEEVRRLTEPGTITVVPIEPAATAPDSAVPDITPWQTMTESIWRAAPDHARTWIREFVNTNSNG